MGYPAKTISRISEGEDRISKLGNDLIHTILSYLDAKVAVQTSVLSKRWKLIWTTLPVLSFDDYVHSSDRYTHNFIRHVLSNRNHQSPLSELILHITQSSLAERFVEYAISHDVQYLNLDLSNVRRPYKLSTLSSKSLKMLTLRVKLKEFASESDVWDLPALTTLHLKRPRPVDMGLFLDLHLEVPELCLICLPSLRTLRLDNWDLSETSFPFYLPHITTLCLSFCMKLPQKIWNFPALLSLELDKIEFPMNMSDLFSKLVNLQSLTLSLKKLNMEQHHTISCPQLLYLYIKIRCYDSNYGYIKVLAPKLCSFTSLGILSVIFKVPELENVTIKLHDWFGDMDWMYRKLYYWMLTEMLSAVGNAKNLTFDLDSIKALAATDFLASLRSPFSNLKIVKLPLGYKESSMSSVLRSYLLGASPRATIVTTLPQSNMIPQKVAVSMTAQNALLLGSLAVPTKDMNVQKEHVLEDSVVADRARHIDAPVEDIGKDQVSSLTGNGDFGVWLGYKVNPEFICLLDRIMHKYPETFENFTTKNKKLCTMNLNILCTSLNDFTKISMTEVDSEMISGYKDVFAYLKNQGFNVSWALSRLNFIERLRYSKPLVPELHAIDCRIEDDRSKLQELQACVDDVKIKLQDLQARVDESKTKLQAEQTLRMQKLIEIERAFGTVGTKLADGFIGNDLLSCD